MTDEDSTQATEPRLHLDTEVVEYNKTSEPTVIETVEESEEDREVEEVKTRFLNAPRQARWRELYLDADNEFELKTFKNATLSAIQAYGLDSSDPKQRQYASELGSRNTRKYKNWAQEYLTSIGTTPEKMLEILADKAINTFQPKYMEIILEIVGLYNRKPSTLVQKNTQNNTHVNIAEAEKKEFNEAWEKFLTQR